jgi:hypothetical protein
MIDGCALGNQYGYSSVLASAPRPAVSRTYSDFASLTNAFLISELSKCGNGKPQLQRLTYGDYSVEYKVRGLRGCIVGNSQWDLLQVSFTRTGEEYRQVSVVVEGWFASGFHYPLDSQFTTNMQPEFSGELHDFTEMLANDFSAY